LVKDSISVCNVDTLLIAAFINAFSSLDNSTLSFKSTTLVSQVAFTSVYEKKNSQNNIIITLITVFLCISILILFK